MSRIFTDGYENCDDAEFWNKFKEEAKNIVYPNLTCVTKRDSTEKHLCLIIAETPVASLIWSAWVDENIQVGDVVMNHQENSFFVEKIDFSDENHAIWLKA